MMERTAENLIKIAKEQLGYYEKASNSQLDDKTANIGSANYNKYARDLYKAGYYNGNKNGYAWCDVFVDWCFWTLCDHDKKEAEAMECQTGVYGAGCVYSAQYYKKAGRYSGVPKLGDQIFFREFAHTGIVVGVTKTKVTTVEGNTENCVKSHTYNIDSSNIEGYGHPRYAEPKPEPKPEPQEEEKKSLAQGDSFKLSSEPLYLAASSKTPVSRVTGTYYYWGGGIVNGKIRITNTKARCGIAGQVTGWIANPAAYIIYTVKAGDTLSKIANAYHTTVKRIADINKISNVNLIHVGEKFKIPI